MAREKCREAPQFELLERKGGQASRALWQSATSEKKDQERAVESCIQCIQMSGLDLPQPSGNGANAVFLLKLTAVWMNNDLRS